MNRTRAAALALALYPIAAPAAAPETVEGTALRLPEGTEVYRERHEITALAHRIEYRAPDGRLIAMNSLDYRCSDSAPDFEQRDLRSGTRTGGRWVNGGYVLLRGDESRTVGIGDALVASSGFDRFVRANWDALGAGTAIDVDFALPARLQTLRLRIARIEPAGTVPDAALWLRIVPAAPLLRAFVDPIVLAYDGERRLALYRGLSNLDDADGNPLDVEIRYRRAEPVAAAGARESGPTSAQAIEPSAAAPRTRGHIHCTGERT